MVSDVSTAANPPAGFAGQRSQPATANIDPVVALDGSKIDQYSIENGQYRYLIDLVRGLIGLKPSIRFVLLGSRAEPPVQLRSQLLDNGWDYQVIPQLTGRAGYYRSMFQYRRFLRRINASLLHSLNGFVPCLMPCPVVATRHDIMYELFPEYEEATRTRIYRLERWMNQRHVRRLLASSATTAADVHQRWGIPRDRLDVVLLGSDFSEPSLSQDFGVPVMWPESGVPVLLTPYNLEPRKNLLGLLQAMSKIVARRPDVRLICYGRTGWSDERETAHRKTVETLGLSDFISYTGFVDDETLRWMYRNALLCIYPTLYEGFGLPILEAMASGTCTVARSASSMAEIAGDCGVLTETSSPEQFADAICGILADDVHREALAAAGAQRAREFSLERMARETLLSYQRAGISIASLVGTSQRDEKPVDLV